MDNFEKEKKNRWGFVKIENNISFVIHANIVRLEQLVQLVQLVHKV